MRKIENDWWLFDDYFIKPFNFSKDDEFARDWIQHIKFIDCYTLV